MLEKLLLAITITFSLNLCLHVRQQDKMNTNTNFQQEAQVVHTILVAVPKNKR